MPGKLAIGKRRRTFARLLGAAIYEPSSQPATAMPELTVSVNEAAMVVATLRIRRRA